MAVDVVKTWETVYFYAQHNDEVEVVELSYNHKTKLFELMTAHEEGISFKQNTVQQAALKVEALNKAIEYLKDLEKQV